MWSSGLFGWTYRGAAVAALIATSVALGEEKPSLPSLAGLPVDVARTPSAALVKHEAALRRGCHEALEAQAGVAVAPGMQVRAALKALGRSDYADSDEAVGRVAYASGTDLAVHVALRLNEAGELEAAGRVVRDDGVRMVGASATATWAPGSSRGKRPADRGREVCSRLYDALGLSRLSGLQPPSTLPPPPQAATTSSASAVESAEAWKAWSGDRAGTEAGASRATEIQTTAQPESGGGRAPRLIGQIGVAAGVGVAAVGGVFLGLAMADRAKITPDERGIAPLDQKPYSDAMIAHSTTGFVLVGAGVVLGAAGGVLWGLSAKAPVNVSVGVAPLGSGAGVFASGRLP